MRRAISAVAAFLHYWWAAGTPEPSRKLFQAFARSLYTGTIDPRSGLDETWLCWKPRSITEVCSMTRHLSTFFDYCETEGYTDTHMNPQVKADAGLDRSIVLAAYRFRREKAFLGHTWLPEPTFVMTRQVSVQRMPHRVREEPPAFPEEYFPRLLLDGFRTRNGHDLRGMLITLLLNGAGLRSSEPFHLFISDVVPNPPENRCALVLVQHPQFGSSPPDKYISAKTPRTRYLLERWGLEPRNRVIGPLHAGWKGGAHETAFGGLYYQAHWFVPECGEIFLALWQAYLGQLLYLPRAHPHAFVNISGGNRGAPYTLAQFRKAHAVAVERIGLTVSKSAGTTLHGHRHAYGRRLNGAKIAPEIIRRLMHHSSIESQQVYTGPTREEIQAELQLSAARLALSGCISELKSGAEAVIRSGELLV